MNAVECDYNFLIFYVNGKRIEERAVDPRTTLAVYLRDYLKLKGTKIGCNEGGCGACTVMISDLDPVTNAIRHYSANSCLTPVCAVFGKSVTTVEAVGSVARKKLHPIQERLSISHGSQCGYCTPGFVMAMYSLLRNNPTPTHHDIDEALQGNLCRCTGYRPIMEAFYTFAESGAVKAINGCSMGENCCKIQTSKKSNEQGSKLSSFSACKDYDPTQELIFPPELMLHEMHKKSVIYNYNNHTWFQPTTLDELISFKNTYPHARIISGNSEVAIELKFRFIEIPIAINPKQVVQLRYSRLTREGIALGMGLSLSEVRRELLKYIQQLDESQTKIFQAVHSMLYYFAGTHVRNMASIAGNIATASPISDLNPIWMASGAKVIVQSEERGTKELSIDENFFIGYRRTIIKPDEILSGILIPFSTSNQYFQAYKQSQRREDDIAIVTSAFSVVLEDDTKIIKSFKMAFGGMAPTTKLALKTIKNVEGTYWNKKLLGDVTDRLAEEFALPPDVPGGMARYRVALVLSFWFKFYSHVSKHIKNGVIYNDSDVNLENAQPEQFSSTQVFSDIPKDQKPHDPIGRPLIHQSGQKHVTGEAIYATDVEPANCLYIALVLSPVTRAKINHINPLQALDEPGVLDYIDANDVPGGMFIGHGDLPVFPKDNIEYHGQPVAAIIAVDHETARRAANLVKIDVTETKPIVTIEQAIDESSYFNIPPTHVHNYLNDPENSEPADWNKLRRVVAGDLHVGGQEHFYLEPHNVIVIPDEDEEYEVISSTQSPTDVQRDIALALGVPMHMIKVSVRRLGGGFGGKESAGGLFAAITAVAAKKIRKPVKCVVERFDDMAISGNRHPFRFKYRAAIDDNDRLVACDVLAYSNSGYIMELSKGVMERCATHIDNVYKWKSFDFVGHMCKTNLASNTAFRGFGGPQAMICTEVIMNHFVEEYDLDPIKFRSDNLYQDGAVTPFGMTLQPCNIARCWNECLELSDYYKRLKLVQKFNAGNKFQKRGIAIIPTKFGIAFGLKLLNQAGALVHVYYDGSVLVTHGGVEMGQGLNTKMLQIASRVLDVPIELVHIRDTAVDRVPNTSPTAASVSSDINGGAVQDACQKIKDRLKPLVEANPQKSWVELIKLAYVNRISLSATGFYRSDIDEIDFTTGKGGQYYRYAVYGAGCAEIEIDCLTGDHHLIRADIVMDIGESLNPAIDIGQIEGAFIQGYGLFTMEEIRVRANGIRLTRGPGNYKIPTADDAPRHFNVKLLKGSSNSQAIFSSKAVGEPPLFLGASAFFAIRNAIKAYREDNGSKGYFELDSPATAERIRLLCHDNIINKVPDEMSGTKCTPWNVLL